MERRLDQRLSDIVSKLGAIMASQDDIDAAVAQINTTMADLQSQTAAIGTDVTNIQNALNALPAEVDTSALNAAVASLAQNQANLDASVGGLNNVVPPPAQ
jgi:hypothetical protein